MRRVLSIAEAHSDSHETLAFCLYELGFLLYYVGKYREAEPLLLRALSIIWITPTNRSGTIKRP
jgi:hypothetical protein